MRKGELGEVIRDLKNEDTLFWTDRLAPWLATEEPDSLVTPKDP